MQEELAERREASRGSGSVGEVFAAFLKLGLTSFGGPIAHLGYFHREFVAKRRWVSEEHYAQLMALCQFLPGPASSQLGFALGLLRGGWRGAIAAFVAFTLPSAILLFVFARFLPLLQQPVGQAAIHGLKLVAVAVVAQGVLSMAQRLTPDAARALIAAVAGALVVVSGSATVQLLVVVAGAVLGMLFCRPGETPSFTTFDLSYRTRTGVLLLLAFAVFLVLAMILEHSNVPLVSVAAALYRAGALVFGGGHVVLPLLEEAVVAPGWVSTDDFLAGYGAAQAVPGPMFSIAAFLGAALGDGHTAILPATVTLLALFLPGFLLVAGGLPLWRQFARSSVTVTAMAGVNAAVVGLLAAALYDPVWTGAVATPEDFAVALVGFALLAGARVSSLLVVGWCVGAMVFRSVIS